MLFQVFTYFPGVPCYKLDQWFGTLFDSRLPYLVIKLVGDSLFNNYKDLEIVIIGDTSSKQPSVPWLFGWESLC